MAYIDPILNEEDQDKKNTGEISTTPETSIITGGGAQSSSGSTGGGQKGWTNLQTYTSANESQSGKMGQDVSQGITNKIQDIETQKGQYNQAYTAAKPTYNTQEDQSVLADIAKGNIAPNQSKIANLYNTSYKGPASAQDVQGYGNIEAGYNSAGVKASNLSDEAGRVEALKSTYGQNVPYTTGEQALDSFILGAGEQGRQALKNAQDTVANSKNTWKKTLSDIAADISANQQYYNSVRNQAQQAVGSKLGEYAGTFNAQQANLNKENAAKAAALSSLQDQLKNNPSSAYNALGIDQSTANFLAQNGFDFNTLFTPGGSRSLGDVANEQDVGNYKALAQIANQAPGFNFSKSGNSADAYTINQGREDQSRQAQQLDALINQRLQQEQAKRDAALASVRSAAAPLPKTASQAEIIKNAQALGISDADYKKALDNNIDLSKFVQAGKKLNAGDVATVQERNQWDSLRTALGLSGSKSLEDVQDEGSAYSLGDILSAIKAIQPPEVYGGNKVTGGTGFAPVAGTANILTPDNINRVMGQLPASFAKPSGKSKIVAPTSKQRIVPQLGQASISLPGMR